ncbi:DUF2199 domain-containing protein [Salipiger abyssi]|uniref:DUF2199 domain-containing protein n=1 Tax=Salipiger abyssi TaxID=1250539 RepID=UPI000975AFE1|nr:DUF2199 domain-containing protein [Salipiger abyssi]
MNLLWLDGRWRRFNNARRACPCCGKTFSGVFDISMDHPDIWPHGNRLERGVEAMKVGNDFLTPDVCCCGDDHLVRCVLPLPIRFSEQVFHFGVWGSLSQESFQRYLEEETSAGTFTGAFSWLSNALPTFDTDAPVPCDMIPQGGRLRPRLEAHEGPIAAVQKTGISFDRLLDIYAATGQDIRPHL